MMTREEAYAVLELPRNVEEPEVLAAHRRLVLQWHPDLHRDETKASAEEQLKRINHARDLILELLNAPPPPPTPPEVKPQDASARPANPHHGQVAAATYQRPGNGMFSTSEKIGWGVGLFLLFLILVAYFSEEESTRSRTGPNWTPLNVEAPTILNSESARVLDPQEIGAR